jgi:hypothetical protein
MNQPSINPLTLIASTVLAIAADNPKADCYVAPNGNDSASGASAAPFASLARAQAAVRTMIKSHPRRPIYVMRIQFHCPPGAGPRSALDLLVSWMRHRKA